MLVSVHDARSAHARQASPPSGQQVLLGELSRRYSQVYDAHTATYDFIELAIAAGIQIVTTVEYKLRQISSKLYLGAGQTDEIIALAKESGAELIVVSAPLNPVHQRNWAELAKMPVLNRSDLIFAIFEQNAHSAEGQLQVELARLKYELPRIIRTYEQLDPLAGGIGTLGPGEQLTERIKRRHRQRIHEIEGRLAKLRDQRALRRRQRSRSGIFIASIVGYTNVGKSTLLNCLTGSGVLVADQYFATLDPTARALRLPSGDKILITDTVGFLDDLPRELVSSFRATLEEMEGASLLLHMADASHAHVVYQIEAVRKIVREIGLGETPELLLFNKCDRADPDTRRELSEAYPEALMLSARTGEGLSDLLNRLDQDQAGATGYRRPALDHQPELSG